MKKLVVHGYEYCIDGELHFNLDALRKWIPKDPNKVLLSISFDIREKGQKGSNFFTATIVTSTIVKELKDKSRLIIIPYYEGLDPILEKINEIIFHYGDSDYHSACLRIAKHLCWEYDYLNDDN